MTDAFYGILIPFLGTSLGAASVFFLKKSLGDYIQRALTGFAAGVMVAASIWSLLIPAMDQSEALGKLAFFPAVVGFWMGILFLLLLDHIIPHLHRNSQQAEGPHSQLQRTTMMVLAVTLHNIPEGMAVGVVYAGYLSGTAQITAAGALALLAAAATADACTRAVYLGRDGLVITGRTMDWKEEIGTNLYLFPRGMERAGYDRDTTLRWRAKYGSVVASAYDFATCDGMNEAGLVASLLFLPESDYGKQGKRPVMGIAMWTQYVLDNFGTVSEAVGALRGDGIYIDAPDMPNDTKSRLHLAISDATGDSAILEYIDGRLRIHEGRQYRVMTNSPRYDLQLAVNDYWEAIGGLKMLPGTNRSSDRFARASFYIGVIPQTADAAVGVPAVLSVMRNVSVSVC